ncbi:oligosaccharide biosynthesis protein Alg14 [Enterococcus sp. LJL128]
MHEQTTLLVAKDEHLYFFDTLTDIDVISGHQLLRIPLDKKSLENKLSQYCLIIFLDNGFEPVMAKLVRPLTNAKLVLFFWNHLTEEKITMLQQTQSDQIIDDIYSFDPLEAQNFSLKHNSSFYSKHMQLPKEPVNHDIFFGASNNGRGKQAHYLLEIFNYLRLHSRFFILEGKGNDQKGYLSYPDYLILTAQSKSILEIMRPGQTGITLRSLESIYFKKKLLTTNKKIRYYHFYNPANIFIIGYDNFTDLPDFLETPYLAENDTFLDFYDHSQWAQRFLAEDSAIFEELEYRPQLFDYHYAE